MESSETKPNQMAETSGIPQNPEVDGSETQSNQMVDGDLKRLITEWLEFLRLSRSRSSATIIAYKSDLDAFLLFAQEYWNETLTLEKLLQLQPRDWRAWLSAQRNHDLSVKTLTRRLTALKSLFQFFLQKGLLKDHPILTARHPRIPKGLPRPASTGDITQLAQTIMAFEPLEWVRRRDIALITLLYGGGLRINEALSLNGADWGDSWLTIHGKGGKIRQIPLLADVLVAVAAYQKACPYDLSGQNPLFVGVKGKRLVAQVFEARVRKGRRQAHLPEEFTPHALRHSCASHLLAASGDLRGIQELLGHSSLSTTQVYAGLEDRELREIYEKAHPEARKRRQMETPNS